MPFNAFHTLKRMTLNTKHMKRIQLSAIFLMVMMTVAFSQTTVTGRVLSYDDKEPLPFTTVAIHKNNAETMVSGTVTNEQGRFVISGLTEGEYRVSVSFVGYNKWEKDITIGKLNDALDLGTITLTLTDLEIGEVVVAAQKQAVLSALDKKNYAVSDFAANASGSVLDLMKSLPGLTVNQEDKIELRGSDKVLVLIDGQQSALTGFGSQKGLENIPVTLIESIEIINNPSSKYDAAGMAGIINIKFKQEKKTGFNGDAGFSLGFGNFSKRRDDLPTGMPSYANNAKYTPSLNVNYKTEKVNLFLQAFLIHQRRLPNNEFSSRYYDNGNLTESQVAENRTQNHYNVKLGFDWNPTHNQTITFFGLYDYERHIDTTRVWYFANKNYKNPIRKWSFYENESTGFANLTLQHRYRFEQPGHEIKSQFLFTKGWEDETYKLYQDGPPPAFPVIGTDKTHVLAPEYIWLLNSDYVRPLSFGRLEAGVQGRLRHMPITYTMTKNPNNTALIYNYGDWSNWDENLLGLYSNFVAELKKFDIEAGFRVEYTSVEYSFAPNTYFKNDKYDYLDLFPNVRLTYKPNPNSRISLFYNRRIDRPGEDILRIFPKYDDPELLKIGNPHLRPQYTQNVEVAHRLTWKTGSFYSALYFKNIDAYYTRVYMQDPDHAEITIKAYDNLGRATNTGLEIAIDQKLTSFWNISGSMNVYKNTIFAHSGTVDFPKPQLYKIEKRMDTPLFTKLNNRLHLPWNLEMELNGVYFSNKNIGQGRELSRGGVDLGLKKLFLNKKLELNLSATDIFNTMAIRQEITGAGFKVEYGNYYETQIVSMGLKYKF